MIINGYMVDLPENIKVCARHGILFISTRWYDSPEQFFQMNSERVIQNLLGSNDMEVATT